MQDFPLDRRRYETQEVQLGTMQRQTTKKGC